MVQLLDKIEMLPVLVTKEDARKMLEKLTEETALIPCKASDFTGERYAFGTLEI